MKKIMACFLIAAMLLSGCGGSQGEESPAEISRETTAEVSGGIDAARKAYEALSEEDKSRFYEEIAAEHEAQEAEKLMDIMLNVCGQWRPELVFGYDDGLLLYEDMTYEFGHQKGTWYVEEGGGEICLVNGEDHVIYFIFTILEEDGMTKLLCQETQTCYVREEEFRQVFDNKYMTTLGTEASELFGEPQYIGTVDYHEAYGSDWRVCVLDSLAYENGLVYVGRSSGFEMEVIRELADGSIRTDALGSPFESMTYYEGSRIVSIEILAGMAYFVRAEYVEDVFLDEDGCRNVLLKNGAVYYDYSVVWEDFPEISYDDFRY